MPTSVAPWPWPWPPWPPRRSSPLLRRAAAPWQKPRQSHVLRKVRTKNPVKPSNTNKNPSKNHQKPTKTLEIRWNQMKLLWENSTVVWKGPSKKLNTVDDLRHSYARSARCPDLLQDLPVHWQEKEGELLLDIRNATKNDQKLPQKPARTNGS